MDPYPLLDRLLPSETLAVGDDACSLCLFCSKVYEDELRRKDSLVSYTTQCQQHYQQARDGSHTVSQKVICLLHTGAGQSVVRTASSLLTGSKRIACSCWHGYK